MMNQEYVAKVWDSYGEVVDTCTGNDFAQLENAIRWSWEGSNGRFEMTIEKNGVRILHDRI